MSELVLAVTQAGILSEGLRIAPPEAPTTGYMFGKGVYFADMVRVVVVVVGDTTEEVVM